MPLFAKRYSREWAISADIAHTHATLSVILATGADVTTRLCAPRPRAKLAGRRRATLASATTLASAARAPWLNRASAGSAGPAAPRNGTKGRN
jgi:hypothetical protein